MVAAEMPIHHVSFEDAQKQWLCTDDGRAFTDDRWPDDHAYAKPMHAFTAFRVELDQKAVAQLNQEPQAPLEQPVDPPSSEPQRTDLSYQIMQERAQKMAPLQHRDQEPPPSADPVSPAEPGQVPVESISWGTALAEDFTGSNVMLKFSRYRTQSERSLYRALNEFNKLQYLRTRREAIDIRPSEEKQDIGDAGLAAES